MPKATNDLYFTIGILGIMTICVVGYLVEQYMKSRERIQIARITSRKGGDS